MEESGVRPGGGGKERKLSEKITSMDSGVKTKKVESV